MVPFWSIPTLSVLVGLFFLVLAALAYADWIDMPRHRYGYVLLCLLIGYLMIILSLEAWACC